MHQRLKILALSAVMIIVIVMPLAGSANAAGPWDPQCLYPSPSDRFAVTASSDISQFDVAQLSAAGYLDWAASTDPPHPAGMYYYPMIHPTETGYVPRGAALDAVIAANPKAPYLIGNEAETVWMGNVTPEVYAERFHDIYEYVIARDPDAQFAFGGSATVSTLRLAWLERAWQYYRSRYGTDMPVNVWNIHAYVVNEMANEWGAEIPTGIMYAVGYGGSWAEANAAGASGGSVHQSRNANDLAYFAFFGSEVTLYLRTGPDAGIAEVFIDHPTTPVATVDLYAPAPGTLSRQFTGLTPPGDPRLGDRHNIRVQVTGRKNSASSDAWIRVDAIAAPSTAELPGGRLENDNPLEARIVTSVDDHDNLDMISDQILRFRQWMADHGQRDKPLINTEYGILMTEDLGFDYPRVRDFMLDSFDKFLNDMRDPDLGYPADDDRLLQQWFWFALALEEFEGRRSHTGLYRPGTYDIKPLGEEYADFVTPLVVEYADLDPHDLNVSPDWPLFAGEPSLVRMEGQVRNWGNTASGPFSVQLVEGSTVRKSWQVGSLSSRFTAGDTAQLGHEWRTVIDSDRTITLVVDAIGQVNDPCPGNNIETAELVAPAVTDLAIANLTTVPRVLPAIPPGTTTTVRLQADLVNLGSRGTEDEKIVVRYWNGEPGAGGTLLTTQELLPGSTPVPYTLTYDWTGLGVGTYELVVEVEPVSEESNIANNRQRIEFRVSAGLVYLPSMLRKAGVKHGAELPMQSVESDPFAGKAHFMP